jgi:hypothetical protein
MALSVRTLLQIVASLTSAQDLTTPSAPFSLGRQINFTDGAGVGQANQIWADKGTISASATNTLDLAGSLSDAFGVSLSFARIKLLYLAAAPGNVNSINLVRPASNGVPLLLAAGDGIPVVPGGAILWVAPTAAGVPVTAGTGDLIDLVNAGGGSSVAYDITIIGAAS